MHTVKAMLERFKRERWPHLKPATKENYERYLKILLKAFGTRQVRTVTRPELEAFLDVPTGKIAQDKAIRVLSAAMSAAVQWKWIDANPCYHIERPPAKRRTRQVTDEQFEALKKLARESKKGSVGLRIGLVMDLVKHTGRLPHDIVRLRWEQIDEVAGMIRFRQNKATAKSPIVSVPITPEITNLLREAETISGGRKESVIVTNFGAPYTLTGFRTVYQRLQKTWDNSGRERISFRDIVRLGRRALVATNAAPDSNERTRVAVGFEYLKEESLRNALPMSIVYTALHAFENDVRDLVARKMAEAHKDAWWSKVPDRVRAKCKSRMEEEAKFRWHASRGAAEIAYCDFGDLSSIIITNWDPFEPILADREWCKQTLVVLERARNVVMHAGVLAREDMQRIGSNIRDWVKQVSTDTRT
jgi:integrase